MNFGIWKAAKACALASLIVMGVAAAPIPLWAQVGQAASEQEGPGMPGTQAYRLDTGDKVKVTVYGEDDLSGEFDVDGSGNVRLPLIGQVRAAGLSLHEFEVAIEAKLSNGYLVNPKVSVGVANYRPFT